MSSVYLAFDPNFKRNVVIKVMAPVAGFKANFMERFRREATTVATLEHPAIVPVYDFGEEDGLAYIVMQHMTGGDLSKRINAKQLSLAETSKIMQRVCGALAVAHESGVIHRDLKPGNILFDQFGNAFLADFGLARTQDDTDTPLTQQQQSIGTPGYMSPEQIHGLDISPSSDIYGLGILVYEMLTGKRAFKGKSAAMTLVKQMSDPIPLPSAARNDLPAEIDHLIKCALSKNIEARPVTALAFAEQLEEASKAPLGPAPKPEQKNDELILPKPNSRAKWLSTRGLLWIAMGSLALLLFSILALQANPETSIRPTIPLPTTSAATPATVAEMVAETVTETGGAVALISTPDPITEEASEEISEISIEATPNLEPSEATPTGFQIATPPFQLPTPENLVQNGQFENGTEFWKLVDQNDGSQTEVESEGELCSRAINFGENLWDILIVQQGQQVLKKNTTYTLSFDINATPGRTIGIKVGSNAPPYPSYLYTERLLRDGPQRITISYIQPIDDPEANIEFHIGATGNGTLCFDNISLTADIAIP